MATRSITIEINADGNLDVRLRDLESGVRGLEGAADSAGDGIGGMGDKVKDFAANAGAVFAGGALLGMVSSLGGKLSEAFASALDAEAANSKLQAQLGLSAQAAEHYGRLAGHLYSEAYGGSLDEVNEALRFVDQNIGDLVGNSETAFGDASKHALNFAAVFDEDISEVTRAVGNLLKTGLANDAQHAFDIITTGMQNGSNAGDDLLETFNEYSVLFQSLGIDAEMALGLISQGMQAGARDSDFLADALKELAIRGKDGSEASAEAFQALGMNAQEMTSAFAAGGPKAEKALLDVMNALKGVKDPSDQATIAAGLFGTKAEDLQQALFALDPSTAVAGLGEVGGAATRMGDALNDNALTRIEAFKRGLQQNLVDFMTNSVLPRVVEFGDKAVEVWDNVVTGWEMFTAGFSGEDVAASGWAGTLIEGGQKAREIFDTVMPVIREGLDTVRDAASGLVEKLAPFWEQIKGNENLLITAGMLIGSVLVSAVIGLTVALGALAISVIAATWPFIAVAAAVFGIVTALRYAYENFDWFKTGVDTAVSWIRDNVPPIFEQVRAALAVAFEWISTTALPFVTAAFSSFMGFITGTWWPAVSTVWGAIFTVISTVVNAIVSVVLPIITAIVGFISTHMNTIQAVIGFVWSNIQNIISNAWQIISNIIQLALNLVSGNWSAAWENIKNIFSGVMDIVLNLGRNTMNMLWGAVQSVVGFIVGGFQSMYNGVTGWIQSLVSTVSGIPNRITTALGNLGSLLVEAGKDVVRGLIRGVENMIGALKSKLGEITNLIPISKGPPEKDRRLLRPTGRMIMGGLIGGFEDKVPALRRTLGDVTLGIPDAVGGGMVGGYTPVTGGMASAGPTIEVHVHGFVGGDQEVGRAVAHALLTAERQGQRMPWKTSVGAR